MSDEEDDVKEDEDDEAFFVAAKRFFDFVETWHIYSSQQIDLRLFRFCDFTFSIGKYPM